MNPTSQQSPALSPLPSPVTAAVGRAGGSLGPLLLGGLILVPTLTGCAPEPPPPPRVVDENPPVEDVLTEGGATGPETARNLLENTWVVVTEVHLVPGGELTLHRDGERVAYALVPHRLRLAPPGAATREVSLAAGEATTLPSGPLQLDNPGPGSAGLVVVTRSAEPLPLDRAAGPRLEQVTAASTRALVTTPAMRVQEVELEVGHRVPRHGAGCRVIYALGPYDLRYRSPDADLVEVAFAAGDAHWHTPAQLEIENVGSRVARFILFAFDR